MRTQLTVVQAEAARLEQSRACGSCTACCVLPRIRANDDALPLLPQGKGGYTKCEHLGCAGCDRYDERPPVCREFMCLWRVGMIAGDERRRPDRIGLMATLDESNGKVVVDLWELWSRAASDHPGRGLVDALADHYPVVIRYYGVPCSLTYDGPMDLHRGNQLSRAAVSDPTALYRWVEAAIRERLLEDPHNIAETSGDLDALQRGVPVEQHYQLGGVK